jgi:hypothetical protein
MRYRWFHRRWVCRTLGWLSHVWICAHTCPVIRHCNQESKVKKTCADYDLAILRSYRYIPSYTKYNLVYTIFLWCWVCCTVGWLSNVWICVHTCPVIRHVNLESKVKKKSVLIMTWLYFVHTGIYQVILCTAWYILRNTTLYLESGSSRLASPFCLGCPLVPCIACDFLPLPSLLDGQAPKAGLAAPKLPQPRVDFVDIAAP